MGMIEQNQPMYGRTARTGCQDRCAITGIKTATTNQRREDRKQEHREGKAVLIGVKYQPNFVTKYFVRWKKLKQIEANVTRLNVSGLFRPLRFSRCYRSGFKKEKKREEKKFKNFYFKML